jgi:DNA modification methylase
MNELSHILEELARLLRQDAGTSKPKSSSRVIHGDCIEVMKKWQPNSVDFVLTDPPYLVNYHARDGRTIAGDKTAEWIAPAFKELGRVMKPDSFAVVFYGWNQLDNLLAAWRAAGLRIVGHVVFPKRYASKTGFMAYHHEQAYLLAKGNPKAAKVIPDVIPFEYSGNQLHPTQKPVSALLPLIEAFSKPGAVVLDPFCGSGSTLEAAKKLGRGWIGIEVMEEYARAALNRLR